MHFAAKLLANRKEATDLIEHNPFADGKPPRYDSISILQCLSPFAVDQSLFYASLN